MTVAKRSFGASDSENIKRLRRESSESLASQGSGSSHVAHGSANEADTELAKSNEFDIDALICSLTLPESNIQVAKDYSNLGNANTQVQAYAKLAGRSWTYYVQRLEVVIGRKAVDGFEFVDIDLGPSRFVSRRHATIRYNLDSREWEITVLGRNGIRVDRQSQKGGTLTLRSGSILDIGGVQMMFVLPDSIPMVARSMLRASHYKQTSATYSTGEQQSGGGTTPELDVQEAAPRPKVAPDSKPYPKGLAIVARPQVRGHGQNAHYIEQDLSSDDCKDIKPPFSYATMISQAILSSPEDMLSLSDIYAWISSHYAFYRYSKPGWQNSIRHNLSLNKAFEKVPRRENEPGKGSKWQITPKYKEDFIKKANAGKHYKGRALASPSPLKEQGFHAQVMAPPKPEPHSHPQIIPQEQWQSRARTISGNSSGHASVPPVVPALTSYQEETPINFVNEFLDGSAEFANASPLKQVEAFTPERGSAKKSGATPKLNIELQLAPPSSSKHLPSAMIPGSSPAPFWKYMHFSSTPVRGPPSPTKSSPPEKYQEDDLLGGNGLKHADKLENAGRV